MSLAFSRSERSGSKTLVSKEFVMSISRPAFGLMLLVFTASHVALADGDKGKPAEAPKEESVVPHDSKTHGALQVKSVVEKTSDWFDVRQNGKRAFDGNPP